MLDNFCYALKILKKVKDFERIDTEKLLKKYHFHFHNYFLKNPYQMDIILKPYQNASLFIWIEILIRISHLQLFFTNKIQKQLHGFVLFLEGVYTWNFIPGWNSSRDEIIPVYGEMSLTVYTFLPRWNFIPVKKTGIKFHPGIKKERKMCKDFIPG